MNYFNIRLLLVYVQSHLASERAHACIYTLTHSLTYSLTLIHFQHSLTNPSTYNGASVKHSASSQACNPAVSQPQKCMPDAGLKKKSSFLQLLFLLSFALCLFIHLLFCMTGRLRVGLGWFFEWVFELVTVSLFKQETIQIFQYLINGFKFSSFLFSC